ncbi:MAG: glycosyltransferase family 2 protein [Salinivirgaceae bacterium]|nr:glycosyltransferase family 2 protein [Salinivirgaceae bacterium]
MIQTAVVILNWNGEDYLKKFLPSVLEFSNSETTEIWVADNGSTDVSISILKSDFPTVKLLELDKNYGFTGGYNRALKQIKAEYYVLLNSDIEVTQHWIEPIIQYMDNNESVAAAMPKLMAYHAKDSFEYAGAAGGFIDKLGFPFCRGRILSEIEKDNGQYNDIAEIFWATGACLFIKAELYHKVGGLDEDFFAHMEEIDLCWRLKNRGYKIVYIPESKVYHVGGGTLPNDNPRKLYLNYRNNLFLLYKNLPKGEFRYILYLRMILDGASSIMYLLQGKFSFFMAVPKAHFSFYSTLRKFRVKRKENIKLTISSNHKEIFNRSIIFSFFVRKVRNFSALSEKGWR